MTAAWLTISAGLVVMVWLIWSGFQVGMKDTDRRRSLFAEVMEAVGRMVLGFVIFASSLWIPDLWLR